MATSVFRSSGTARSGIYRCDTTWSQLTLTGDLRKYNLSLYSGTVIPANAVITQAKLTISSTWQYTSNTGRTIGIWIDGVSCSPAAIRGDGSSSSADTNRAFPSSSIPTQGDMTPDLTVYKNKSSMQFGFCGWSGAANNWGQIAHTSASTALVITATFDYTAGSGLTFTWTDDPLIPLDTPFRFQHLAELCVAIREIANHYAIAVPTITFPGESPSDNWPTAAGYTGYVLSDQPLYIQSYQNACSQIAQATGKAVPAWEQNYMRANAIMQLRQFCQDA